MELVSNSRSVMSGYYAGWDAQRETFHGERQKDKADGKARERKEPEKLVVPMTHAQVQTFIAFCYQLFTQRSSFYELTGTGMEDMKAAKIAEALLNRDLNWNKFTVILYQFLLNIGIEGLGVIKHGWHKEVKRQLVTQQGQPTPSLFGAMMPGPVTQVMQDVVKFLGNKLIPISPYRFFPDPRLPVTQFQEGEFCASEIDMTRIQLKRMEAAGLVAGVEHIKDMSSDIWQARTDMGMRSKVTYDAVSGKQEGGVVVTEVQREIIPSEYKLPDGKPLGEEDTPCKYIILIANDNRILRCDKMGYVHDHFTYSAAQLNPDQQEHLNKGIAGLIDEMQNVITWLFNSRITAVRKTLHNSFIVDPEGVELSDLTERKSIIRLKKGVSRSGVDRWIKSLDVQDVTSQHIQDATTLGQVMQLVSGINENALGQYSQGRRSAEQTRAVNSGAASRLKMYASLIWGQALQPLGEDLLSNLRDGLDVEQIVRVTGLQSLQPQSPYAPNQADIQQFLGVTKADLVGNYDFTTLDGTLPTEKFGLASILQDLLGILLSNPQAAAILGIDPRALLMEIAELNQIRNPERFLLQPQQQQLMMQNSAMMNGPVGQIAGGAAQSAGMTQAAAGMPQNVIDIAKLIGSPAGEMGAGMPQLGY